MNNPPISANPPSRPSPQFYIRKKKVKWVIPVPTYNGSVHGHSRTLEDEVNWHKNRYPGCFKEKKIGQVNFVDAETYESDGRNKDYYYGWGVALFNAGKLLKSLGYKDFPTHATSHHNHRHQEVNKMILNIAHAVLVDYKLPHLPEDFDEDENAAALPIFQQILNFQNQVNPPPFNNITGSIPSNLQPTTDTPPSNFADTP